MKILVIFIVVICSFFSAMAQSFEIEDYSRFHLDNRGVWYIDNSSIEYHGKTINFWTALNNTEETVLMFMSTELNCTTKQTRIWKTIAKNFSTGKAITIGRKTGWLRRDGISIALVKELCK